MNTTERPTPPEHVTPDWFKCKFCERSQPFAPAEESGGVTVEEAEALG